MPILCTFLVRKKITWGKDALFDTIDDHTDVLAAIEEFANINNDDAVLAWDGFVDEENDDWYLVFWSKSQLCAIVLEWFVWNGDEEEMNIPPLGVL